MIETPKRSLKLGVWYLLAAGLGLLAAFSLTMERFHSLAAPEAGASCDFSIVIQCSANLTSWQGSIFGFPNPLLGLMAWPFVLLTGVLVLANVKLPKFYWYTFLGGVTAGFGFVLWLMAQSIYVLGTLCPWCMVTWVAMVPTFFATVMHMGQLGFFGEKAQPLLSRMRSYVALLALLFFIVAAGLAQLRLDWISHL